MKGNCVAAPLTEFQKGAPSQKTAAGSYSSPTLLAGDKYELKALFKLKTETFKPPELVVSWFKLNIKLMLTLIFPGLLLLNCS